ncbi:hypothetical protein TREMEDRAFT_69531 [Tremella mesenterica DSM 1558]|uniref:uncharacterized protein n=1 Tax=Tremella mesenterica (strain ATCC 24925 / CBS 8224 / DSM 1558 / NBRC 9311 / NRRL Y-6157 / RJB 2259-6 / UBC 559-6) TaxID=578456 RepID=UPI0003F4A5F4|nr:uncharacterized protein TREMEDRAFT_69531 [Tremella mesenterica DSM 1558]EIW68034.1 hypothetical protein TREMEDRAFT_69531 [Tremella mesenterica DSM 1558]
MAPLLSVKGLSLRRDEGEGSAILHDFNLEVEEGEVVIIKGPSGCGKTTLLKCIAELSVYQSGEILLDGNVRVPKYRTLVQYVPQRPSLLPGTPAEFLETISRFSSRKKSQQDRKGETDPMALAEKWGIERTMWGREWATLSGGEGQRIALALAVGIGRAEVVLLDEPTSALDEESMKTVERSLLEMLPPLRTQNSNVRTGPKALIWITHEASQADRVGTRTVDLSR